MRSAPCWKFLSALAIVAVLALSGCGGGDSVTAPLGVTSTTSTSQTLAASATEAQADPLLAHARSLNRDDPDDDENVWDLAAEAWILVADAAHIRAEEAARIRAETATSADNSAAAETRTLAAQASDGKTQAARALATETQDTVTPGGFTTSFKSTRTDHYPLDAQNVRPEQPELIACVANDIDCQAYNQLLLHDYEVSLRVYKAGRNWQMVEEESEIASRDDVLAMFRESVFVWKDQLTEFQRTIEGHTSPPVVRFLTGTRPESRAVTLRAIDNINAWLPYEKHITVGNDIDEREIPDPRFPYGSVIFPNVIIAKFDSNSLSGAGGVGNFFGIEISQCCSADHRVIQHELLHAMGLDGGRTYFETFGEGNEEEAANNGHWYLHVPVSKFPESEMAYASPYDDRHGLSQIDGEMIQAVYTRESLRTPHEFEPYREHYFSIGLDNLSPDNLGPWDESVIRYSGSFERMMPPWTGECIEDCSYVPPAFGVDWRNGMARPWADGDLPNDTIAETRQSGAATWTGELVGFTPAREAVHGESAIEVNLTTLTGEVAFTALQHWSVGTPPDDGGTGAQWSDGDLRYSLELDGNYLRSNGGDEGYVSGRFVGGDHHGVVGILERSDLTGAFGATRQP